MSRKTSSNILRLGTNLMWDSKWCVNDSKVYSRNLSSDLRIRKIMFDLSCMYGYTLGKVLIWRSSVGILNNDNLVVLPKVIVYCQIFGGFHSSVKFKDLEKYINLYISKLDSNSLVEVVLDCVNCVMSYKELDISLITKMFLNMDAYLISYWLAKGINQRKGVRNLMHYIEMGWSNVPWISFKISFGGRFLMVEYEKRKNKMARTVVYRRGNLSMSTLSKRVLYGFSVAHTADGTSGVKVYLG